MYIAQQNYVNSFW